MEVASANEEKQKRKKYSEKAKEERLAAKKAKNEKLEKELWVRLYELNPEFDTMKDITKQQKK